MAISIGLGLGLGLRLGLGLGLGLGPSAPHPSPKVDPLRKVLTDAWAHLYKTRQVPYAFSESDLRISARQLRLFVVTSADHALSGGGGGGGGGGGDEPFIPYAALQYCIGQCNYGGRVTDSHDRRTLLTLTRRLMAPELHTEGFRLFPGEEHDDAARLPTDGSHAHYARVVQSLPAQVSAEMVGLHANAELVYATTQAEGLYAGLLRCIGGGGGGGSGGGGEGGALTAAQAERLQAATTQLQASLPGDLDLAGASARFPVSHADSLRGFLLHELGRYNKLLRAIRDNVAALRQVRARVEGERGSAASGARQVQSVLPLRMR